MADEEEQATQLDRDQVISLIGKHASQLATLARQHGCTALAYLLRSAAEQAEQDLNCWSRLRASKSGCEGRRRRSGGGLFPEIRATFQRDILRRHF